MTYPKANEPKTQEYTMNKNLRVCQQNQNNILAPIKDKPITPATANIPTNNFENNFM